MSLPTQQKVWILANPPSGPLEADTFAQEVRPLPALKDGEVLVRMDYLSNDPAQRQWIQKDQDPERQYLTPVAKGEPIRAGGIATVLDSKSAKYATGSRVTGLFFGWYDVGVVHEDQLLGPATELPGIPTACLSVLGLVSVTAYQGIFEVLKVNKDDVVVVSGAAGAVGSVAVQLAKHVAGAKRVVGIAGGPEKCDWVVKHLGADACVDYKAGDLRAQLKAALGGEYATKHFENVGGEILNTMFTLVARHGHIAVCGTTSGYLGATQDLSNIAEIIFNRIVVEGFLVLDMGPKWPQAVQEIAGWITEGKIKTDQVEQIVEGTLEQVPDIWKRLWAGESRGKLITKLVA